jgi:hypothetical protein
MVPTIDPADVAITKRPFAQPAVVRFSDALKIHHETETERVRHEMRRMRSHRSNDRNPPRLTSAQLRLAADWSLRGEAVLGSPPTFWSNIGLPADADRWWCQRRIGRIHVLKSVREQQDSVT